MTGGDLVVRMLREYDVRDVFGLPGDTSLSLYDAMARDAGIRHILVRDERSAAYMADGYARVTGRVGVCEGPSGGGALYISPGVAEADGSRVPVVCLASDTSLASEDRGSLTALDQTSMFSRMTRFTTRVVMPEKIPETIRRAFRCATGSRQGASHVALPENVLSADVDSTQCEPLVYAEPDHSHFPSRRYLPVQEDLRMAASLISSSERPLVLCGGGVHLSGAYVQVRKFVEKTSIPVVTSLNGKGSVDENHPFALGVVGTTGGKGASNKAVEEADLIIVLGSRLNSSTTAGPVFLGKPKRTVQVDCDVMQIGNTQRVDVGLVGDIAATLDVLLEMVEIPGVTGHRQAWVARCRARVQEEMESYEGLMRCEISPLRPHRIVRALERALPAETVIVYDAGTPAPYLAALYRPRSAGRVAVSGRAHGSLGYAIPAAVGAKVGRPDLPVVALFGDGSFEMSVSEIETVARLNIPVIMVCMRNGMYGWIKCLQQLYYQNRFFGVDFGHKGDYCDVARAYGLAACRPESGVEVEKALARAVDSGQPYFIDVPTEPMTDRVPPVRAWQRDMCKPESERIRRSY